MSARLPTHPPSAAQWFTGHWPQAPPPVAAREGILMANKSPRKTNGKKVGKTLKEKQTAKRVKRITQAGKASNIPPTDH